MSTSAPSMPKGIVLFVPWITTGRGGTENVGHMLANGFAGLGHRVHVVTFDDDQRPSRWPLADGISLFHAPTRTDSDTDFELAVQVAALNPDLLIGLHLSRAHQRYVRCAHQIGCPLILSEHIDPRYPAREGTFGVEERVVCFSGATRIHLLTEAFRKTLPEILQSRVRIIPNAVPLPDGLAEPASGTPVRILSVARLVKRKNISRLLSALAEVVASGGDCELTLVGDGPERKALQSQVRALGLSDRVQFVGEVEDTAPHYAGAHLFVLPSIYEAFPMSSLEAMSHGLPVVGYGICSGLNIQVLHGETGLLSSGGISMGSLASDIGRLVEDHELRARMGAAGRDRVASHYSEANVLAAWNTLAEEAIAEGPSSNRPDLASYLSARCDDMVWGDLARLDHLHAWNNK